MDVPQFKSGESVTSYLRRVEQFKLKVIQDKYNLLLEFVNEWLKNEEKFSSLIEFVKMPESKLLHDLKHNRDILRKYSDEIINKLNPKFDIDDETASDEIDDSYIIHFFSRACAAIDYKLVRYTIRSKTFYSVKRV